MDIQKLIEPYSPWLSLDETAFDDWDGTIPEFKRPIYETLVEDMDTLEQIISLTGPRRIGKSTLLKQIIKHLLKDRKVEPNRIVYYSFDDPALFTKANSEIEMIDELMNRMLKFGKTGPAYLFLDEIQTLERWELYLKKYYDLKYPIRIIISGSAASPIFKKSRESLMGRIKEHHLLPFSFREYLLFHLKDDHEKIMQINKISETGKQIQGMFVKDPKHVDLDSVDIIKMSDDLWNAAQDLFNVFVVEGGFPEVWSLPTAEKKIEYLYDNQINKVITEDLVLATELRKPEQLKRFYISLLENPGQEVSMTSLSTKTEINLQQINKYLPLLEMTDLIRHASKFRKSSGKIRSGNRKYYLVDMALRNAVLRIGSELISDPTMMGFYAENLVFNALRKWRGTLGIDYYRENNKEVDFVMHLGPSSYLPIEVKYRNEWSRVDVLGLQLFSDKYPEYTPLVVTKRQDDFGAKYDVMRIPLLNFLLMFD